MISMLPALKVCKQSLSYTAGSIGAKDNLDNRSTWPCPWDTSTPPCQWWSLTNCLSFVCFFFAADYNQEEPDPLQAELAGTGCHGRSTTHCPHRCLYYGSRPPSLEDGAAVRRAPRDCGNLGGRQEGDLGIISVRKVGDNFHSIPLCMEQLGVVDG